MYILKLYNKTTTCIIAVTFPKTTACISAPINMTNTEKIFSVSVLADTFPKPTDVNDERVKYNDVVYRDRMVGPSFFLVKFFPSIVTSSST